MKATSVGFMGNDWEKDDDSDDPWSIIWTGQELLEFSLTNVGSNRGSHSLAAAYKELGVKHDLRMLRDWSEQVLDGEKPHVAVARAAVEGMRADIIDVIGRDVQTSATKVHPLLRGANTDWVVERSLARFGAHDGMANLTSLGLPVTVGPVKESSTEDNQAGALEASASAQRTIDCIEFEKLQDAAAAVAILLDRGDLTEQHKRVLARIRGMINAELGEPESRHEHTHDSDDDPIFEIDAQELQEITADLASRKRHERTVQPRTGGLWPPRR